MAIDLQARINALKAKAAANKATAEVKETTLPASPELSAPVHPAATEPAKEVAKPVETSKPVDPLDALDAAWDTVPSVAEIEKAEAVQVGTDLSMKIAELEDALISAHPKMPTLLREIHSKLRNDAEVVTMLEPSKIGVIVTALRKLQGIELLQKASKSKTTRDKLKNVTVDEL